MKRVVIIGGGASGILAAIRLADITENTHITILEKNERIGKKLLTTGNGRCNISNARVSALSYDSRFVADVLSRYDFELTKDYLFSLGLPIKEDDVGRCYPLSESANNCLNIFLAALRNRRIEVLTGFEVTNIKRRSHGFIVCGKEQVEADAVLLAFGSAASVKGYNGADLLHNLQFSYRKPSPALCPIPTQESYFKALKGLRVKGSITLGEHKETGEIQFNENNLSGICAFNLAKYVEDNTTVFLNFSMVYDKKDIRSLLYERAQSAVQNDELLDFLLPRKLAFVILKRAGLKPSDSTQTIGTREITALTEYICAFPVKVNKPTDFRQAQTVCGGLDDAAVNPHTLEARELPGLFISGELLDVDGPCGGYNLQWAWSSGLCAADSIKAYLEK